VEVGTQVSIATILADLSVNEIDSLSDSVVLHTKISFSSKAVYGPSFHHQSILIVKPNPQFTTQNNVCLIRQRVPVYGQNRTRPMHSADVEKAIATKHENYDSSANADWIEPNETLRQAGNCLFYSFVDPHSGAT
jgi:hypothetical protein